MQCSGIDREEVYILIEDFILNKETNMNMFNSLISSGEVKNYLIILFVKLIL